MSVFGGVLERGAGQRSPGTRTGCLFLVLLYLVSPTSSEEEILVPATKNAERRRRRGSIQDIRAGWNEQIEREERVTFASSLSKDLHKQGRL